MIISNKYSAPFLALFLSSFFLLLAGCFGGSSSKNDTLEVTASSAITSTAPADGSTGIHTNTKVVAVFPNAMSADTLNQNSFSLLGANEMAIVGAVAYDAETLTATLTPNSALAPNTLYTATITTGAKSASNVALKNDFVWSFTTGTAEDTTAPTVSSSNPTQGATGVLLNTQVNVVFDEAIDPTTLNASSFELKKDAGVVVAGNLRYINPTTVVFSLANHLDESADYTLALSAELADLAGNTLAPTSIAFKTGTEVSSSPAVIDLGTAGNYVILAKTGISTTGTTQITGDIAVSPETRTALTGFNETLSNDGTVATSPLVTGSLYAANMTSPTPTQLTTAVSNMEAAYTDAAGRVNPDFTELGAGEIGGLTLDPGLYKWGTGVLVTSDVTLNGSATDIWIFQIGQDLKLEDGKAIELSGGALPENIFWQVAGEVTLQAGATFNGVILSQTGIVLKSGAVINGRALAQTAVTLISNEVNQPAN